MSSIKQRLKQIQKEQVNNSTINLSTVIKIQKPNTFYILKIFEIHIQNALAFYEKRVYECL